MPELPEVETIRRQLSQRIKNKTIKHLQIIDYQKNFHGHPKNLLAKIANIQRRAKLLIFRLSNNFSFLLHLKLTGQLIYHPKPPLEIKKSTHLIFTFNDGSLLFFNDFRKFGFLKVMKTDELETYLKKQNFGPEPLALSFPKFKQLLQKKPQAKLKPLLMDQTFIAGLGNIYTQEACFSAGILPTRTISSLTNPEIKKLYQAIKSILKSAIKKQGTSFDTTYVQTTGKPGSFDINLKVYHRKTCSQCKNKLKILKLGGRSTYYCSECQK